jgi:hypothetical protein
MAIDPLLIAQLDFRPVPVIEREQPGRVKSVPARLYIDKYIEHREAYNFIQEMQDLHGEGTKTVVRALLHYRDTIIVGLEEFDDDRRRLPEALLIGQLDFRPVPPAERATQPRIKNVAVRMYIDKYIEHRWAYEFVKEQQDLHGEGNKIIVRALVHYRDTVITPLQQRDR